ncbi:MAG: winged helix-turn-helix domain-containing protein [Candidatus Doudnabacteria bacterium]|nr:winged helix-turn-helix domain-containing protein [Candidatus Doudnabacteria bacterium]
MAQLSDIDAKLAAFYLPQIIKPIKYGENGIFFWFPGAGMTTILRDIFNSKELLKENLGQLAQQIKIIEISGHLADKKNLTAVLREAGFAHFEELKNSCTQLLEEGYEPVYVISRIDNFSDNEKLTILKSFIKLNALNPRRVHILFNSFDKPWFLKALNIHPELLVLATRMEVVPVINGSMLKDYINTRAKGYSVELSDSDFEKVVSTYGGILQLTKEFLRSNGQKSLIDLKFGAIWGNLPESYRDALQKYVSDGLPKVKPAELEDLQEFGVLDLTLYDKHKKMMDIDPEKILHSILTPEEQNLWAHCKENAGQLIDKDAAAITLRPQNSLDISLWALDKAVSRFRAKLAKAGIDPENLKTIKGKGYIWHC